MIYRMLSNIPQQTGNDPAPIFDVTSASEGFRALSDVDHQSASFGAIAPICVSKSTKKTSRDRKGNYYKKQTLACCSVDTLNIGGCKSLNVGTEA